MTNKIRILKILFLSIFISAFLSSNTATAGKKPKNKQPNFVFLIGDDCTWNDIGCYGGQALTPNIDKLATDGLQFQQAIGSCAMCTPTLHSFYTGMYPMKHGGYKNHSSVNPGTKSICHYLKDLGYRVGHAGKTHIKPAEAFPFEFIEGFPRAALSKEPLPGDLSGIREFMTRDEDQPFCLVIYSIHPHWPYTVGDRSIYNSDSLKLRPYWADTPETRSEYQKYLAEVTELDNCVGDVVGLLDDEEFTENTLFMFASEQGGSFPGEKWTLWDNGVRFGLIARWPGRIKPDTQTQALVQYEDILPTFIEAAGGSPVPDIDGRSILDVLLGKRNKHREYAFGTHNNRPDGPAYPIRSIRDRKYKLILNLLYKNVCIVECVMTWEKMNYWKSWIHKATNDSHAAWAINRYQIRPEIESYDIENDPDEINNLADKPEYAGRIRLMRNKLEEWMKSQGDKGVLAD